MKTFYYEGGAVRASYNDFAADEIVYLELGPSTTDGSITFTILDASQVRDPTGPWPKCTQSFRVPNEEAITVFMQAAAERDKKKIHLYIKPNSGLPGESPV